MITISESMKTKIKTNEGLSLTACKCVPTEKYWSIGYGHYGSDIKQGQKITKQEADAIFDKDIAVFDTYMHNKIICKYVDELNQDMYDALISFCYNCGPGNLQKLCNANSLENIPNAILAYNKSGTQVLPGLTRRRKEESDLFKQGLEKKKSSNKSSSTTVTKNTYKGAFPIGTMRKGAYGEQVKRVQQFLNWYGYKLSVDMAYGIKTEQAVKQYQKAEKLTIDGIWGNQCLTKAKQIKR